LKDPAGSGLTEDARLCADERCGYAARCEASVPLSRHSSLGYAARCEAAFRYRAAFRTAMPPDVRRRSVIAPLFTRLCRSMWGGVPLSRYFSLAPLFTRLCRL